MSEFRISVDLSQLAASANAAMMDGLLPQLDAAVQAIAEGTAERWRQAVKMAPGIWYVERNDYMASIRVESGDRPYTRVVLSDYRHAEAIENGRPARDLKSMLDSSEKVRTTKDGRRYLIIPFRHGTPGNDAHAPAMPQDVYDRARTLAPSSIIGQGRRPSGTGAFDVKTRERLTVNRNLYNWGDRLPEGLAPKLRSHHKTDPYAGMVRFDTTTPGGGRHSTYLTFRVMMEGSSGWIVPAKPGLHLAERVAQYMRPIAEKEFSEAIQRDYEAIRQSLR